MEDTDVSLLRTNSTYDNSDMMDYSDNYVNQDMQARLHMYETLISNLSDWQWSMIQNYTIEGQICMLQFWFSPTPNGTFCNGTWDSLKCWSATPANTTVTQPCPPGSPSGGNDTDAVAHRRCTASGEWENGNWTNYTMCLPAPPPIIDELWKAAVLRDIYFYGSILSCILLAMTLFVFCCFKSLQCSRISIHKNLVVSFIIRSVIFIAYFEPFVTERNYTYREIDWLCKVVTSIMYYSIVANIFWMFVEGLFLHNRVAVSVFNTEAPFRIFYIIGWGSPGLIVLAWAICMHMFNPLKCWNDSYGLHYTWIIVGPVIVALVMNTFFLVNIIRILITKLRANNTVELDQIRKAVKATAILFPLLGMTHLLFFFKPEDLSGAWEMAYRIPHAIFQASQGVFVSVIYCFMNSEVRVAVRKRWQRYKSQQMGNRGRRRSSAARSSTILMPLNGGTDKSRRSRNKKRRATLEDYSVTFEEDLSTIQAPSSSP